MKKLFLVVFLCTAFLFMGSTVSAYNFGDPTYQGIYPEFKAGNFTFGLGDDYKIDPVYDDTFTIDGFSVEITVVNDPTLGQYFNWSSDDGIIEAIIVKGSTDSNLYDYSGSGPFDFDEFLHAPLNSSGKYAGLSHIEFKGSPVPEPTTMLLLGAGLVGLAGFGRKRFKK
jgi:hypothetical protein